MHYGFAVHVLQLRRRVLTLVFNLLQCTMGAASPTDPLACLPVYGLHVCHTCARTPLAPSCLLASVLMMKFRTAVVLSVTK